MSLLAPGNSDPGRLDRRVVLLYPNRTRDATGGVGMELVSVGTVWAGKQPLRGGRLFAAEAKQFESVLVYRIRAREDIAAGWFLAHGDDVFEIVDVQEQGREHYLDLAVRGINQTPGNVRHVRLMHGAQPSFRTLHDGSNVLLHTAA